MLKINTALYILYMFLMIFLHYAKTLLFAFI